MQETKQSGSPQPHQIKRYSLRTNIILTKKQTNNHNIWKIITICCAFIFLFYSLTASSEKNISEITSSNSVQIQVKKENYKMQLNSILKLYLAQNSQIQIPKISENYKLVTKDIILNEFMIDQIKLKQKKGKKVSLEQKKLQLKNKLQLKILKHQKLTSVRKQNLGLLDSFLRPFFPKNPYGKVDDILKQNNVNLWESGGNMITVYSNHTFRPFNFRIKFGREISSTIYIFGLTIEQTYLVTNKGIGKTLLGKFKAENQEYLMLSRVFNDHPGIFSIKYLLVISL